MDEGLSQRETLGSLPVLGEQEPLGGPRQVTPEPACQHPALHCLLVCVEATAYLYGIRDRKQSFPLSDSGASMLGHQPIPP